MLITLLLLAILMIGAVSASDENVTDTLTVEDDSDEIEMDSADEELMASDDSEIVGDSHVYGNTAEDVANEIKNAQEGDVIYLDGRSFEGTSYALQNSNIRNITIHGGSNEDSPIMATFTFNGWAFWMGGANLDHVRFVNIKSSSSLFQCSSPGSMTNCEFINCESVGQFISWSGDKNTQTAYPVYNCTFINCHQTYNSFEDGHGQFAVGFGVHIDGCNFINTSSAHHGGAICIADESRWGYDEFPPFEYLPSTITNTNFIGVTSRWFAVYIHGHFSDSPCTGLSGNEVVENCTFINCSATEGFGACLGIGHDDIVVRNCKFINNTAGQGAAIMIGGISHEDGSLGNFAFNEMGNGGNNVSIINCTFVNNTVSVYDCPWIDYSFIEHPFTSSGKGGAIYVGTNSTKIADCVFDQNTAYEGGAIAFAPDSSVEIFNSNFTNNSASNGGAIHSNQSTNVDISNSKFLSNVAVYRGGAIYSEGHLSVRCSTFDGNDIEYRIANDHNGGAAIYNHGGTLVLDDVNVTNNLLNIVIRDGDNGDLIDAAISTNGDTLINNSYIANNTGSYGGGVLIYDGATLTATNSVFEGNNATYGGAIYCDGAIVNVDNCTFNNNAAVGSGSYEADTQGGAIAITYWGSATIVNSRFNKNSAAVGGAVSFAGVSDSSISNCNFTENSGSKEGGAIYSWTQEGKTVTVSDSIFTDNTANFASAISNDGKIILSHNTISGGNTVPIGNYYGTIESETFVVILDNTTVVTTSPTNNITAYVSDDAGNRIVDKTLVFIVNGEEVLTAYNRNTGVHTGEYTFINPGTYVVGAKSYDAEHVSAGELMFESPLSMLQDLINNNTNGTVDLKCSYAYVESYDLGNKDTGIIIDKDLTINGNGLFIGGGDISRIFTVNSGKTLTLNNVSIINGNANEGAGVYVNEGATLLVNSVLFANNLAANEGGAIYLCNNADGQVNHCTFSSNRAANNGGAIYSLNYLFPVSNSHFAMNSAVKGSAIYNCTVEGCTFEGNAQPEIYPIKVHPEIEVTFNQTLYHYGQSAEIMISLPSNATGVVNVAISTKKDGVLSNYTFSLSEGSACLFVQILPIDLYNLTIQYSGDPNYYEGELNTAFSILPIINITEKVIATSYGQITMDFGSISDDFVDIFIDGKRYASLIIDEGILNYTFSTNKLPVGNHAITFKYDGTAVDENLFSYWDLASGKYKPIEFTIEILPINVIIEPETSEEYEYYEACVYDDEGKVATDAEGTIEFFVNGVSAAVVKVVNGIALLDISKYKNGQYEISWKYSGDSKYNKSSGRSVMKINRIPIKIVAGDLSIVYTSAKVYSVKVYGVTGKIAKGAKVIFLINNKAHKTVKTNANGVANIAISKTPGSYKITTKALGATVTKKLTVQHALSLKTVKVKTSAKKLVIKVTLKKIDGKYLKGKKITLKFNGKKFTAKTSKKGVAKFTVKSSVLKKLKAGKKVKYQATYKKDTVKKSVKVKK